MTNRWEELKVIAKKHKLDEVVICGESNILALTGVRCDNAMLTTKAFYTDFRYAAMVRRVAPELRLKDIAKFSIKGRRIGFESSVTKAHYDRLVRMAPARAKFVDILPEVMKLRSVKTESELKALRAASNLNCDIWEMASKKFRAGMTERQMAAIIKKLMIDLGDGEAFSTIVCVGKNAAECHHEPDDTIWNGRDAVLVDMGVKLNGVCSDLTRNLKPKRQSALYRQVYNLVREAHDAAIRAARPGMTAAKLDKVARDIISKGGFGKCFGHSLGHGVGYDIHEAPTVSRKSKEVVLKPGMVVTIEPGIYLEDNLGVRIEDMIAITETGCELLTR